MTNTIELNYLNLGTMDFATLELPASSEEISEFFAKLNPNDQDCELQWCEMPVGELKGDYNSFYLSQYKELAEVEDLEEFDMVLVACDNMFDVAMQKYTDGEYRIFTDCKNDFDLGWEIATESGIVNSQDDSILSRYFDYEKFGQDCRFNGSYTQIGYDTMIEIFY